MEERIQTFDEMYRETLLKALARTQHAHAAAQLMGISIRTFTRWLRHWDISFDYTLQQYVIKLKNQEICPVVNLIAIVPPATKPAAAI